MMQHSDLEELEEEYYTLLNAIQGEMHKTQKNKLNLDTLAQLNALATKIHDKRRKQRQDKPKSHSRNNSLLNDSKLSPLKIFETPEKKVIKSAEKPKRIKPYYLRLLNEVFSVDCLNECLLQFFTLEELLVIRQINKNFRDAIMIHFADRIRVEEKELENMVYSSEEFSRKLRKICITQFPRIKGVWLNLDKESIKYKLASTFTRSHLENMKYLQNVPEQYDKFFAPFCAIFDLKPFVQNFADGSIETKWKKPFITFVSNPHFVSTLVSYDLTKIKEEKAIQLLDHLNKIDTSDEQIKNLSVTLSLLVEWCRLVFDCYLVRNIYKVRFPKRLENQEQREVLEMFSHKIGFLRKIKTIANIFTEENYLLDFADFKLSKPVYRDPTQIFEDKVLRNIISYLEIDEAISLRAVNKKFKAQSEVYLAGLTELAIYFYETTKFKYVPTLYKKIPILFEFGLLSKLFLILEHILKSKELYITKKDIEELKRIQKSNAVQELISKAFCVLFRQVPRRKPKMDDGYVEVQHFPVLKNVIINKNYRVLIKNFNILYLSNEELIDIERALGLAEKKNAKLDGVFSNLYVMIKAIVTFHKIMNPLIFTPPDYIYKRFTPDEQCVLEEINLKYEDLKYFMKKMSSLKLWNINQHITKVVVDFNEDELNYLNATQKDIYDESHTIYFNALSEIDEHTYPYLIQRISTQVLDIFKKHESQDALWAPNKDNVLFSKKLTSPQKKFVVNFRNLNLFIAKIILDFLPLEDVDSFSKVNKDCNEIFKIYIHLRIHVETERIKSIEEKNKDRVQKIMQKKSQYYNDYELPHPSKENAVHFLTELTALDITEIKSIKSQNEILNLCASPFIILFEDTLKNKGVDIKNNKISSWSKVLKLILSVDFYKTLVEYHVETVPPKKIRAIEKYFAENLKKLDDVAKFSTSLLKLVGWLQGLVEIHRYIRKFYISIVDFECLEKEEIEFSNYMDRLQLRSYMILRSIDKFSEESHLKAKAFLDTLEDASTSNLTASKVEKINTPSKFVV